MIKFIASDLDGTLLNDDKCLPTGIFDTIEKLYDKGILFAPASGRQYDSLKKLFAPVQDKIVFICENGALVKYKEETLSFTPADDEGMRQVLSELKNYHWANALVSGENRAYIETNETPFSTYARAAYTNCILTDDLQKVIGKEKICKIAVYDKENYSFGKVAFLEKQFPFFKVVASGSCWLDIAHKNVSKGQAIKTIEKLFSLKREECLAFGDHMNDLDMLEECGHAYVTENAFPELKKRIKNTVPSNNEGGVMQFLNKLCD